MRRVGGGRGGTLYLKFVPYALEKGNNGDAGAPLELLRLLRQWGFSMFLLYRSHVFGPRVHPG